ncbi:MAG: tRNA lysidine(34) synthetase TilS [Actinomycetota bacterium]
MADRTASSTSEQAAPPPTPPTHSANDLDALAARCTFPPAGSSVVCAYSGGADSTAMLALARHAELRVTACHIDHGVHDRSAIDADRAVALAASLDIECQVQRAVIEPGPNLEARARTARYALLPKGALTAHTADDQAETLLLALLRGTGIRGLGGIRPSTSRPMLALRRAETAALCRALGLIAIDDPTNHDPRFRRNRVRHELLPVLNTIAARDVVPLLTRTADTSRADEDLLEELSMAIDPTDTEALRTAPLPLSRRAIRRWLRHDGYPPDAAAVERVLLVACGQHRACEVAGRRVERRAGRLTVRT